jgi:hypothetical protein
VTATSRSQWNGGFRSNSGPSRVDPCRRAIRPIEASKGAIRLLYVDSGRPLYGFPCQMDRKGISSNRISPFAVRPASPMSCTPKASRPILLQY